MSVKLPETTQNMLGASLLDEDTWTLAEQKLLEQAIKTYPASDPERWDKVWMIFELLVQGQSHPDLLNAS